MRWLSFLLLVAGLVAWSWPPAPHPIYHWHQYCLYAPDPETGEGRGKPAYPCDDPERFQDI